jgi:hypothetical protein
MLLFREPRKVLVDLLEYNDNDDDDDDDDDINHDNKPREEEDRADSML